jgi:hypothetical protein
VRTGVAAAMIALAIVAAACSDDDDAADPTTTASATTEAPDTSPDTTEAATTVATTAPSTVAPTTAPPTTQSPEQLTAEVTAAFVALEDKNLALLMNPKVPNLQASIDEIAVPGSPYAQQAEARVNELIANGQSVRLNDPDLRKITVERVNVLDPPQYTHVNVTVCQVGNAILVKNAEDSPIPGRSIPVSETGKLSATRYTVDLVLTGDGWRHSGVLGPDAVTYPDAIACPPA